ncbi:MAG: ABC transporter ATP-binding protein [Candidatus Methanomethylophilaceae archaeon]|nr:cobalamin transport system ATP-binding protein [Candidatus Methanomethylophilaceae archaeon]
MSLDVRDLFYNYDGKPVLKDVSFQIKEGEILGILGPNGCGKTTLLGNLNRNLSPKGGCVMLDGRDLEEHKKKDIAKDIAVVPQDSRVGFSFTVREIVSMGRMPFQEAFQGDSPEDLRIIDDAMKKTNVLEMADRYINTMSGGERQKVIIARAVAQTPKILLMDEPTLHLDISAQFDILDLVYSLSRNEGLTVVIVSHDLPMVARYCDRIMMIHDYTIHALGKTEDVLTPENMRTVFGVDAELSVDSKTGKNTIIMHGSTTNEP